MKISGDAVHEECGVFGIYSPEGLQVSRDIYYGLMALQHRGQESAGISVSDTEGSRGNLTTIKGMGLVSEVFSQRSLENMTGNIGEGHVRYSTTGASVPENAQPIAMNYIKGSLALVHNGNITNAEKLKEEQMRRGQAHYTSSDSEVLAYEVISELIFPILLNDMPVLLQGYSANCIYSLRERRMRVFQLHYERMRIEVRERVTVQLFQGFDQGRAVAFLCRESICLILVFSGNLVGYNIQKLLNPPVYQRKCLKSEEIVDFTEAEGSKDGRTVQNEPKGQNCDSCSQQTKGKRTNRMLIPGVGKFMSKYSDDLFR